MESNDLKETAEKALNVLRYHDAHYPGIVIMNAEKAIAGAKLAGVDVSAMESEFPGLEINALVIFAIEMIHRLEDYGEGLPSGYFTSASIIYDTREAINAAQDAGANVSSMEAQIVDLVAKANLRPRAYS